MFQRLSLPFVLALLVSTFLFAGSGTTPRVSAGNQPTPHYTINTPDAFIYVPSDAAAQQPVQVLVAMHGMGGTGATFCQDLLATAERNGWVVVAPTFRYQDYKNPALVLQDDTAFLPRLAGMLDRLPGQIGLLTRQKVLLYGHSRGGQAVHRFATYYPERTLGVAALSAGSYTLPLQTMLVNGRPETLAMPYGVADMRRHLGGEFNYEAFKRVPFMVLVGGRDGNPNETPRAWDPYIGRDRIERAQRYTKTLQDIGVAATLRIDPEAGHGVSLRMHDEALAFLQGIAPKNALRYGGGAARGGLTHAAIVGGAATARR